MISKSGVAVNSGGPLACVILSESWQFLGVLAELRKATVSFAVSARLSVSLCLTVGPHGKILFELDAFS